MCTVDANDGTVLQGKGKPLSWLCVLAAENVSCQRAARVEVSLRRCIQSTFRVLIGAHKLTVLSIRRPNQSPLSVLLSSLAER